jgi:mannose-6-phosphate isomerase
MELYPLQFAPILKDRLWGGVKLNTLLNKPIHSDFMGESWEISSVEGDVSVVSNGFLSGKSLDTLIDQYPEAILGIDVYERFGKQFPLLFKFLDAKQDLSIQVHPNDELAKKHHNSFGKTEMWYVMQADDDAKVIAGFNKNMSPNEFIKKIEENDILSTLDVKKAAQGDVFFLETGIVHAIGAGIVIAEIQQTSDITYRLYDFDRKDVDGNKRELHLDLGLESINFNKVEVKKEYEKKSNFSNSMVDCPYFTTNFIPLDGNIYFDKKGSSFTVFMCVEGAFELEYQNVNYQYRKGDTILIPASLQSFSIKGTASILEIYIS